MNSPDRFMITETEPVPLVRDFQSFLDYVAANKPYLTPKGYISGKDLFEINKGMTYPIGDTTVRSGQQLYPQLHLFFHLAQAGRLIQKASGKVDKTVLQLSDRATDYSELTPTEKYVFLLETLWVDTNWKHVEASIFKGLGILDAQTVLGKLAGRTPNVPIRAKDLVSVPDSLGYLWIYFSHLGFWTVTQNKEIASAFKRSFYPGMVTPLPLGVTLAPILIKERNYVLWNLPFRRELGEWKVNPGQPLPEEYLGARGAKKSKKPKIVQRDQTGEPFFLPFVPLFAEGELRNTLPRETEKTVDGIYLFRVALAKGTWRKIEISSNHTLLDLHNAIQNAFQFDSDHLYSFFMDSIPWSDEKFSSPYEDEGPHVDEVKIGELGLAKGQTILYLFDYGDEWHFHVTLEEIQQSSRLPKKPQIIESKGKSPEQYPNWEE
jgi:hypothetical protein